MTILRSTLYGAAFTFVLAAVGCSAFSATANPSSAAHEPAWSREADSSPVSGAPRMAPAERQDTIELAPGALLEVWLNDRRQDIRTIASERSLGVAVVRGDFFRYNAVNSDPDLRGMWNQPLLLKWSGLLEITDRGPHVFVSELVKERGYGAMGVRTLVRINGETVFERDVRVTLQRPIFEADSRVLTLVPGHHRLEVWLAVDSGRDLPPGIQLGTLVKIRAPGQMTAEPVQSSRIWHRVR